MDRLVYVAMSGAKETLHAMAANNHNLANVSTSGFRADMAAFQASQVQGAGLPSRAYAMDTSTGWDSTTGAVQQTGRDLDVAIRDQGWITVQSASGTEAYTRGGNLHIDENGMLLTSAGHPVLGDSGPLSVPPHASVTIGSDGTISVVPAGQTATTVAVVGRIKLVNPPAAGLVRRADGLFEMNDGSSAPADSQVHLMSGALESSNVDVAHVMTNMIELSRRFDLQVKVMRTAEETAGSSTKLLQTGG